MYSRPYNPDRLAAPHRSKRYSRRPVSVQTGRNSRGRRLPADRARLPGRFPGESQCFYCRNGYSAGHGVHLRAPPWSPNNSLRQQQVRRELRTRRESVPPRGFGEFCAASGWMASPRQASVNSVLIQSVGEVRVNAVKNNDILRDKQQENPL